MYLEFDISVSHCVPDTFLQTGNEIACKVCEHRMDDSSYRLNFHPGKKNEIRHYS